MALNLSGMALVTGFSGSKFPGKYRRLAPCRSQDNASIKCQAGRESLAGLAQSDKQHDGVAESRPRPVAHHVPRIPYTLKFKE